MSTYDNINMSSTVDEISVDPTVEKTLPEDFEASTPVDTQAPDFSYPRVADKIPTGAWFVLASQFFEKFAFYGASITFQNYLQFPAGLPNQAGALGLGQPIATALTSVFNLIVYTSPILGGIISDQWLGPYKTLICVSVLYALGLTILTITSLPSLNLVAGLPGFIVAALSIAISGGAVKAIAGPFAVNQYTQKTPVLAVRNEEKVIIDPALNLQSIYVWFYFAVGVGCMLGIGSMPFVEINIGYWLVYLLPTISFFISVAIIFGGNKYFIHASPSKQNIFAKIWKVYRKQSKLSSVPEDKLTDEEVQDLIFFNDLKETFKIVKMFPPVVFYWIVNLQVYNNLISQAATMKRPRGVSGDIMGLFACIAITVTLPILDIFVYPFLRRHNVAFGPIRKFTVGLLNAILAMLFTTIVQVFIYRLADRNEQISIWWQLPTLICISNAEVFVEYTYAEFAYSQASPSMKSVVAALSLLPCAIANLILIGFSNLFRDPYMHYVFGSFAAAGAVITVVFHLGYRHYDAELTKKQALMKIAESNKSEVTLV